MLLSELELNKKAHIESYTKPELEVKLLEFGLTTNTKIEVINITPFGGPLVIQTENGKLALRKDEASSVVIKTIQ